MLSGNIRLFAQNAEFCETRSQPCCRSDAIPTRSFCKSSIGKKHHGPAWIYKTTNPVHFYSTLQNPQSALYSLHITLCTPPFLPHTPCTLRPPHTTVHTLPATHYTQDPTLKTQDSTLYTARSRHSSLCTQRPALHTLDFAPHGLHSRSTLSNSHFRLHTLHSTLCAAHSTLQTLQSKLYIPHSTLHMHASPTSPQCYFFLTRFRRCAQTHQAHHLQNIMFRSIHSTARCEGVPKIDAKLYPQTPTANKKPRFFGAFGKERREHSWQARRAFCDKRQIFPLKVSFL